jgi:hypothetical protein
MKLKQTLSVIALSSVALTIAFAQEKRVSPTQTAKATIDGADISISYGAPYTKDPKTGAPRKIWGGLVPYGKVWRTGANEATTLTTSKSLQFGSLTVPAGTYTIFTQPEESGGKLIFNKQTGQWGTKYDASQDFGRVDMTKKDIASPVDQFNIVVEQTPGGGGMIHLRWEKTELSAAFTVKS